MWASENAGTAAVDEFNECESAITSNLRGESSGSHEGTFTIKCIMGRSGATLGCYYFA